MTTSRKPMSARGQEKSIDKLDKYSKESKAKAVGKFMRTFSRTKTSQFITTWDDPNYLLVFNAYINAIADASGDVDSNTVGDPAMLAWLDLVWELYFENANLKDLVAADEAAWKLYWCVYFQIAVEVQLQYNLRCLLPAYTEDNAVPGSTTTISYMDQSSFDIFVSSMKEYPAPKGVNALVDLFCTWIIKVSEGYEQYSLRIPEGYVMPFAPSYDLLDLEAMRALLRVNLGGFETHCLKYGMGKGTWSDPKKPRILTWDDVDVIAYLNHIHFVFYDNVPAQQEVYPDGGMIGTNLTTNYTLVEYFFKSDPNESAFHVLTPWFGIYNGTNNPYGGIVKHRDASAAEYKINALTVAHHGTSMTTVNLVDKNAHVFLAHMKAYDDGSSVLFRVNNDGTNFTAAQHVGGAWKLAVDQYLLMGYNRGATETSNDLLNYLGRLCR